MSDLVELEDFFPDIEPELQRCPVPVIENRIRDCIIDACERANLWRWQHPEILLIEGETRYELATPTSDTLVHSLLDFRLDRRADDRNRYESTHEEAGFVRGHYVSERGNLHLGIVPTLSTPPAPDYIDPESVDRTLPDVLDAPADPGALGDGASAGSDSARWDINSVGTLGGSQFSVTEDGTLFKELEDSSDYLNIGITASGVHTSGKYYLEVENPTNNIIGYFGFYTAVGVGEKLIADFIGSTATSYGFLPANGRKFNDGSSESIINPIATGTRIFMRIDYDTGLWEISIDGTTWLTVFDNIPPGAIFGASISTLVDAKIYTVDEDFQGVVPSGYTAIGTGEEASDGTTQADIDAYTTALGAYNDSVAANLLKAQEIAAIDAAIARYPQIIKTRKRGLDLLLSIKPSRHTLEVSAVLWRDYYQLIVEGTLAKALMMKDRQWSDPALAKEYEKKYEYSLAKAKQAIDRGFKTGSQRIRRRKFA